jgi:hypothetical protein
VCSRWLEDYDAFFEDMGAAPPRATLDRIDYNGNYDPENCRWASWGTQANNKRVNVVLEHRGEAKTLTQWAEALNLDVTTLWRRLNVYNMPTHRALTSGSLAKTARCGTVHMYMTGCRCSECRAAHALKQRAVRAKRKQAAQVDAAGYAAIASEIAGNA